MDKPDRIYWNADLETYEAAYSNGYILPIRSGYDAQKLADEFGMEVDNG